MVELGDFKHDQAGGFMACCERSEPLRGNDKGLEFFFLGNGVIKPGKSPIYSWFSHSNSFRNRGFPSMSKPEGKIGKNSTLDGWLCPLKGLVSLSMHRPGCLMDVSEAIYDTKKHFRIIGVKYHIHIHTGTHQTRKEQQISHLSFGMTFPLPDYKGDVSPKLQPKKRPCQRLNWENTTVFQFFPTNYSPKNIFVCYIPGNSQ